MTILIKINNNFKLSRSINNLNLKTKISKTNKIKDNLSYIDRFRLFADIDQYLVFCPIFHNPHIDNLTSMSDIKLNS